jgi:hypothetical protein
MPTAAIHVRHFPLHSGIHYLNFLGGMKITEANFQGMCNVLSFDACSTVRGSSADDIYN